MSRMWPSVAGLVAGFCLVDMFFSVFGKSGAIVVLGQSYVQRVVVKVQLCDEVVLGKWLFMVTTRVRRVEMRLLSQR